MGLHGHKFIFHYSIIKPAAVIITSLKFKVCLLRDKHKAANVAELLLYAQDLHRY